MYPIIRGYIGVICGLVGDYRVYTGVLRVAVPNN